MYGLDPKTRKAAIDMVVRIAERTRQSPPPMKAPSRAERVKIRWTDEMIARLRVEASRCSHDIAVAARLGYPPWCRDAIRRARCRLGMLRGQARSSPHTAPPRDAFAIAARLPKDSDARLAQPTVVRGRAVLGGSRRRGRDAIRSPPGSCPCS